VTGEVDRATIIRLLEAAKGDVARACAQELAKEGDQTVALFQTKKAREVFSIYTDGSVSRLIGCQIHKDARGTTA
jgi:hypothetical protein